MRCSAYVKTEKKCVNGFAQNEFCEGLGIESNKNPESKSYKLSIRMFPQCLWTDNVTQGETE